MILAININNTNTSLSLFADTELIQTYKIATHKLFTGDRYLQFLHDEFINHKIDKTVEGIIIGSVVPSLDDIFRQFVKVYFAKEPLFASTELHSGITFLIDHPSQLGADRLSNVVAANIYYPKPSIIVDVGTAITFEVLSKKSEFLGGAIVPGIGISYEALIEHAELLDDIQLVPPKKTIGTNTTDNIQSGVIFGFASLVDGMIQRMAHEMGARKPYVIGTGGAITLVAPHTVMIDIVDPELTAKGLALLLTKNLKKE